MEQLSLWDAVEGQQEEAPAPDGYRKVPAMGETMEINQRWADGDTRPESLERLAHVLRQPGTNTETIHACDGAVIWFKIISTRVEGDHVVATLQRIAPRVKGCADWSRGGDED